MLRDKTLRVVAGPAFRRRLHSQNTTRITSDNPAELVGNVLPPRPLSLATLLSFGRPLTPDSVLESVSYALSEIPRRLASRVQSLEALPYIVGTNPYIANTLKLHRESLQWLATYPAVQDLQDNAQFAAQLEHLVLQHTNDIPTMAKGFQECSRYMSSSQISNFLDGAIRNRISVRLIAEQHIALSRALMNPSTSSTQIGVVDMACSPADMVKMCGSFVGELCEASLGASPSVVIDGQPDATFAYIPVHLEYVLTEVLKNSFRATVEKHHKTHGTSSTYNLPPVLITIAPPPNPSQRGNSPKFLSIRVRDQGGGVSPSNMARIFSYAFTTAGRGAEDSEDGGGPYAAQQVGGIAAVGSGGVGEGSLFGEITGKGVQTGLGTIAGLGYGLPMSQLYAKYFGGSLNLVSLDGWGTDVFLKLRCLSDAEDALIC